LILGVLALSLCSAALGAESSMSQCTPTEQVVFSCTIGAKTLSLCKSGANEIHYRFGKPGQRPDLVYSDAFYWDYTSYTKGSSGYMTFKNADTVYTVYKVQKVFSEAEGDTGSGVFVMRDGLLKANLRCAERDQPDRFYETLSALGLKPSPFGTPPQPQDEPLKLPLFAGEWEAAMCPGGDESDMSKCSHFWITLFEKSGRLCGVHSFATAGAGRLDEGLPPSLVGTISGPSATITATSGRASPQVTLPVMLTRYPDQVHWKALTDEARGDALLPGNVWLHRAKQTDFSP
jgi:hypothetical protein